MHTWYNLISQSIFHMFHALKAHQVASCKYNGDLISLIILPCIHEVWKIYSTSFLNESNVHEVD